MEHVLNMVDVAAYNQLLRKNEYYDTGMTDSGESAQLLNLQKFYYDTDLIVCIAPPIVVW